MALQGGPIRLTHTEAHTGGQIRRPIQEAHARGPKSVAIEDGRYRVTRRGWPIQDGPYSVAHSNIKL